MMIQKLIQRIKGIDQSILKIVRRGSVFSLYLGLFASLLLLSYCLFYPTPMLFYTGLSLIKTSLFFFVQFIACGFAFDIIKKQMA